VQLLVRSPDVAVDRQLVGLLVEQDRIMRGDEAVVVADQGRPRVLADHPTHDRRVGHGVMRAVPHALRLTLRLVEPPRRTQAERRAETERRVLEATMTIVATDGVRAVTMAAVGDAAGYSRGIVNHQFGTRDGLMTAVAKVAQSRFSPVAAGLRGRERLLSNVVAYLAALRSGGRDARVFLRLWIAAIGGEEPGLRAAFVERDAFFRESIASAVAEGIEDGTIRGDVDAAAAAFAIVGQLRGISLQLQLAPGAVDLDALSAEVSGWLDRALRPPSDH
jgi:AcrR family transcriptional regulator